MKHTIEHNGHTATIHGNQQTIDAWSSVIKTVLGNRKPPEKKQPFHTVPVPMRVVRVLCDCQGGQRADFTGKYRTCRDCMGTQFINQWERDL